LPVFAISASGDWVNPCPTKNRNKAMKPIAGRTRFI
jgi:hypothetical protein